jgi:PKD repeat protein
MAFDTGISSAIAQYVYTQSGGDVTEPIGGSYLQAYCEYLGATTLIGNSWLITLCDHFEITQPVNGSWTIALANYYGITYPTGGTWWMALALEASPTPPAPVPFIWNLDTLLWETETRVWNIGTPVAPTADFTSDTVTVFEGQSIQFLDTSTGFPTSWNWTFTGGTPATSNDQNPLIEYNTAGTFSVSLEVTNALGSDTKTVPDYLTVNVIPVDYNITDFDNGLLGMSTSQYNALEFYNDLTYIKIND